MVGAQLPALPHPPPHTILLRRLQTPLCHRQLHLPSHRPAVPSLSVTNAAVRKRMLLNRDPPSVVLSTKKPTPRQRRLAHHPQRLPPLRLRRLLLLQPWQQEKMPRRFHHLLLLLLPRPRLRLRLLLRLRLHLLLLNLTTRGDGQARALWCRTQNQYRPGGTRLPANPLQTRRQHERQLRRQKRPRQRL